MSLLIQKSIFFLSSPNIPIVLLNFMSTKYKIKMSYFSSNQLTEHLCTILIILIITIVCSLICARKRFTQKRMRQTDAFASMWIDGSTFNFLINLNASTSELFAGSALSYLTHFVFRDSCFPDALKID